MNQSESQQTNASPPKPADIDPRIYMAAERTLLAWLRTGIALMGFGFVIARFGLFLRELSQRDPASTHTTVGFSMPTGIVLIVLGIAVIGVSVLRHRRYIDAIDRNEFRSVFGYRFAVGVASCLAIVGVVMAVYLAML